MLKNIHVKNFALIDEVEIDLMEGLNVLTGETGAGKSIIIDAVNFALGARVSKDVVRDDADYALSELVFSVDDEIAEKIKELDIEIEDEELIFTRKISNGKSSARVNGQTVIASQLRELAGLLIDIHGQHDNQSLLNPSKHLGFLDSMLGVEAEKLLNTVSNIFSRYNDKFKELLEIDSKVSDKDRELDLLRYQLNEIDAAALKDGEDEELEALYKKMSSAKKIAEVVTGAHRLTGYESEGAGELIGRALSAIRQISDLDNQAGDLGALLTDIDSLLNDFNRSLADYEAGLEFSDEDFNDVEIRLNTINILKSKYGSSVSEILKRRDEISTEIDKLMDVDAYRERLANEVEEIKLEYLRESKKLSELRFDGAQKLSKDIEDALKDLNFLDANFLIKVSPDEDKFSPKGIDKVDLLISTNPGEKLKMLSEVASGGEMSRIMLAIKSVIASKDNIPTLIFDEIDTGISGRTAQKVSEKMSVIARQHQVICVTHLPQIAAMADSHYEIVKEATEGRTVTSINMLSEERQIEELARMLGGVTISDAVMANAKDMKEQANIVKANVKK